MDGKWYGLENLEGGRAICAELCLVVPNELSRSVEVKDLALSGGLVGSGDVCVPLDATDLA